MQSAQSCGKMLMGKEEEDPLLSYVRKKRDRHGEKSTILLNRFHNYHVTSGYRGYNHRRQAIF